MLNDAVYWQDISQDMALDIYQRTAVAWGHNMSYHLNSGPESIDLTNLFEQYKMLETLKRNHHEKEITCGG